MTTKRICLTDMKRECFYCKQVHSEDDLIIKTIKTAKSYPEYKGSGMLPNVEYYGREIYVCDNCYTKNKELNDHLF